jgi:hypothetical protein
MFQTEPVVGAAARDFSHTAYPFLAAALAVGLFSMALIQTFKDLLPIRRWFQRSWVLQWLDLRRTSAGKRMSMLPAVPNDAPDLLEDDLVRLAADGDRNSFYNLPIEQLCGQLNSAAQSVLDHPEEHPQLLSYLAAKAEPEDIAKVVSCSLMYRQKSGSKLNDDDQQAAFTDCVDARNRVAHQVQRAIDALQLSAGNRWKFWIQIFSIALSGLVAIFTVPLFADVSDERRIGLTLLVALLGGFFAPVARDLFAGLQSLGK